MFAPAAGVFNTHYFLFCLLSATTYIQISSQQFWSNSGKLETPYWWCTISSELWAVDTPVSGPHPQTPPADGLSLYRHESPPEAPAR